MMHFSFNIEHKIIPDYWDDFIFYEAMEYILIKKKTSYEIFHFLIIQQFSQQLRLKL